MIYIKWFLLVVVNLLLKYLVAWPLTPFIVLFVNKDGELPSWLFWFTTPDNTKLEDSGWINESRPYLKQSNSYQRYVNRCHWLWRNSLYGFNESVLSYKIPGIHFYSASGNDQVSNYPNGVSGYVYREIRHFESYKLECWQWYFIWPLPFWKVKCLRINIGWKLFPPVKGKVHLASSIGINKYKG